MKHSSIEAWNVSRETAGRLRDYEAILLKWTRTINLISAGSVTDVWRRHFEDSLRLLPFVPPSASSGIDMGSGAGFPGLVLAIASGIHFDLIECDQRKAAFLREVIAATDASASVHVVRIEQATVAPADLLTARALAPLEDLLALGSPLLKSSGTALFHKGMLVGSEIAAAKLKWDMRLIQHSDGDKDGGAILEITELGRRGD